MSAEQASELVERTHRVLLERACAGVITRDPWGTLRDVDPLWGNRGAASPLLLALARYASQRRELGSPAAHVDEDAAALGVVFRVTSSLWHQRRRELLSEVRGH